MSDERRQYFDQRDIFLVAFSVFKCRKLLDHDMPKRIALGVLNHQLQSIASKCVGFVTMPEHLHCLIWREDPKTLSRFIHGWKRISSHNIRKWYKEKAPNYFDKFGLGIRFWQPKSDTFHIYSARKLQEKLDYLHLNPVRAKLVNRAVDWKWNSARWYLQRRSVGVKIKWIEAD